MRIMIKDLELGPVLMEGEIPQQNLDLAPEEIQLLTPVHVRVQAEKHPLGIRIQGVLSAQGKVLCVRCLEAFETSLSPEFELFYQPHDSRHPLTGEIELAEKDTSISFFAGDGIEVANIVLEQVLLGLPMKPVCREECLGLCPNCGSNRNQQLCHCETVLQDPRLEPLLKIKNRISLPNSKSK
jgi:uncharacterized protein